MKKHFNSIILTFLLLIFATGCSGQSIKQETTAEVMEESKDTEKESVVNEKKEDGEKSKKEDSEIVNLKYEYVDISDEVKQMLPAFENLVYQLNFKSMELSSTEYPFVNEELKRYQGEIVKDIVFRVNKSQEVIDNNVKFNAYIWAEPKVVRADNTVLSLEYECYSYVYTEDEEFSRVIEKINEENYDMNRAFNFDLATGKILSFEDIVKDEKALSDTIKQILKDLHYEKTEEGLTASNVDTLFQNENIYFTIGYDSLNLRYIPRKSDTDFEWTTSVPLREYPNLFALDYSKVPKSYMTYLNWSDFGYVDLNNDGVEELFNLEMWNDESDESYVQTVFILKTKEKEYEIQVGDISYEEGAVIARLENGQKFLYLADGVNDYERAHVINLNSNDASLPVEFIMDHYFKAGFVDPNHILVATQTNIVGTMELYRKAGIQENGSVMPETDVAFFDSYGRELTTKAKLKAIKVDENFNEEEQNISVSVGEVLLPVYTDNSEYVIFRREDESLIKIQIKEDMIDGKLLHEVFDGLVYAG